MAAEMLSKLLTRQDMAQQRQALLDDFTAELESDAAGPERYEITCTAASTRSSLLLYLPRDLLAAMFVCCHNIARV